MLKILQARFQQYVNQELPLDLEKAEELEIKCQHPFTIKCQIIEKAREFQKNIYFCFIDYVKPFGCIDQNILENS